MQKRTFDLLGITCLIVTTLIIILAFAPPYWLVEKDVIGHVRRHGLWIRCSESGNCLWCFDSKKGYENELKGNYDFEV